MNNWEGNVCVVVAVVDVREKRKRMAARSKPTASLSLLITQLSTCTAPASPRARPNPDVGGISPVIKTSSRSYLIDIHVPFPCLSYLITDLHLATEEEPLIT